jgi:hypothetical protein
MKRNRGKKTRETFPLRYLTPTGSEGPYTLRYLIQKYEERNLNREMGGVKLPKQGLLRRQYSKQSVFCFRTYSLRTTHFSGPSEKNKKITDDTRRDTTPEDPSSGGKVIHCICLRPAAKEWEKSKTRIKNTQKYF